MVCKEKKKLSLTKHDPSLPRPTQDFGGTHPSLAPRGCCGALSLLPLPPVPPWRDRSTSRVQRHGAAAVSRRGETVVLLLREGPHVPSSLISAALVLLRRGLRHYELSTSPNLYLRDINIFSLSNKKSSSPLQTVTPHHRIRCRRTKSSQTIESKELYRILLRARAWKFYLV
jgi:hypothetical protein